MSGIQRMEAKERRKANRRMKLEREKEQAERLKQFIESPEFEEKMMMQLQCKYQKLPWWHAWLYIFT